MIQILDIFLNLDKYLSSFVQSYDILIYLLIFAIIFLETGLVIFPFLPGDSLLFAVGALSGIGLMNLWLMLFISAIAAILGDSVNYSIGRRFGTFLLGRKNRLITSSHLKTTQNFYDKHGNKTIVLARFVPIVRTFAPFVAGIGRMKYSSFISYNILGGIAWVAIFILGGFLFGNIPAVQQQIHWIVVGIIILSLLPIAWKLVRSKLSKSI